jgi:hypothetical protein
MFNRKKHINMMVQALVCSARAESPLEQYAMAATLEDASIRVRVALAIKVNNDSVNLYNRAISYL